MKAPDDQRVARANASARKFSRSGRETREKNRPRLERGGQPADAYRRMLVPAEASLCKCLAELAGASLDAYRANAYKPQLSVVPVS